MEWGAAMTVQVNREGSGKREGWTCYFLGGELGKYQ